MWSALWNSPLPVVQWIAVIGIALVAAVCDARNRKIPNSLTGPAFVAGLVFSLVAAGFVGLADSAAGCLMLAFPFVVLFVFAGGGAGDAKLMAALGAWLGIANSVFVLTAVSLAGLVLAVTTAVAKRRLRMTLAGTATIMLGWVWGIFGGRIERGPAVNSAVPTTIPYGLAILSGVCLAAIGVLVWRTH